MDQPQAWCSHCTGADRPVSWREKVAASRPQLDDWAAALTGDEKHLAWELLVVVGADTDRVAGVQYPPGGDSVVSRQRREDSAGVIPALAGYSNVDLATAQARCMSRQRATAQERLDVDKALVACRRKIEAKRLAEARETLSRMVAMRGGALPDEDWKAAERIVAEFPQLLDSRSGGSAGIGASTRRGVGRLTAPGLA